MAKYRKRPVVIEAWQYGPDYAKSDGPTLCAIRDTGHLGGDVHVHTPEGPLRVSHGDWIIRGVNGELSPCKPDVFEKTYEKV